MCHALETAVRAILTYIVTITMLDEEMAMDGVEGEREEGLAIVINFCSHKVWLGAFAKTSASQTTYVSLLDKEEN